MDFGFQFGEEAGVEPSKDSTCRDDWCCDPLR
jgi:hypothetical protein